jgi:hypothetical protein
MFDPANFAERNSKAALTQVEARVNNVRHCEPDISNRAAPLPLCPLADQPSIGFASGMERFTLHNGTSVQFFSTFEIRGDDDAVLIHRSEQQDSRVPLWRKTHLSISDLKY